MDSSHPSTDSTNPPLEIIVDRISDLPDELRGQIVSRMPFQDATRMSCLARRWRNICRSLTNLTFDQSILEPKLRGSGSSFKDFVLQTLQLHDGHEIEKFRLIVDVRNVSPIDVNSWVSVVTGYNLKDFYLSLMFQLEVKLPCCLFSCETLRVMTLHNMILSLPESIGFPKLETLTLRYLHLTDEDSTHRLLSSCLLLKKLFIINISMGYKTFRISCSNLKHLTYDWGHGSKLEISAPSLREIAYFDELPKMSVDTLSSLVTVDFKVPPQQQFNIRLRDVLYRRASDIMTGMHNVSKMTLSEDFIEHLTWGQASFALQPTCYHHLEHLQLEMYPSKSHVQAIILLLQRCPNLKCLFASLECRTILVRETVNLNESWQLQKMSSEEGLLKNLKTANIGLFVGSDVELDFVKCVVENAVSLEKMHITYSCRTMRGVARVRSSNKKISEFTKASPGVVISFENPLWV